MKILVGTKRVVDYNVKVRLKPDQSGVNLDNVKMSMNPFDEIAVEEAIRLKEQGLATEILLVSIGTKDCEETLRHGLGLGADRAILIETDQSFEPLNIAKIFKAIIEKEKPELVILGKQAIDNDCNQTGQMLAALLDWPQACFVSTLKLDKETAQVTRETDNGLEMIKVSLPAVITTDLRLNEPRYTSLPNIMKAKQKPLEIIPLDDLSVEIKPHCEILSVTSPKERAAGVQVDSFDTLINTLKEQGLLS